MKSIAINDTHTENAYQQPSKQKILNPLSITYEHNLDPSNPRYYKLP